jgi:DNA polymerase III alpha subunit
MKNILKDRVLWYDGSVTFSADQLADFVLNGGQITNGIHVDALNEEVKNFNKFNPSLILNVKRDLDHLDTTWNIPESYKNININKHIQEKLIAEIEKLESKGEPLSDAQVNMRIDRVKTELDLYKEHDMYIILKTIIYIVDTFKMNNVVWGTGRGSSCASYILYLIGLHNVDSVKYEVELKEFFK